MNQTEPLRPPAGMAASSTAQASPDLAAAPGSVSASARASARSVAQVPAPALAPTTRVWPRPQQRSLFGEILDWMLAPLLLLWPMSVALTWLVATAIANRPYDRDLGVMAQTLAEQAVSRLAQDRNASAVLTLELERTASVLLRTPTDEPETSAEARSDDERRWFQILGLRGELLAGVATLAVPADDALQTGAVHYRDERIGEEPVRVATVRLRAGASGNSPEVLVQVAETLGARSRLATEIIKGVILPQFVILPLAVVLVWFALSRGIRPLAELQARIRLRESTDLSPIAEGNVPDEVVPLVRSINELLERLDRTMAAQRHFLADAAHQLKTPLAGLRTQAELAAREIDSGRGDPASMKHSLRQIAISTQRAAHMVNQLLAMARAEDSGLQARRQPLDLAAVVRAVVRDAVPRALERHIDLGYEGPDSGDTAARVMLNGEPVLLSEMVRNLLDNALHYTPAGGTVTARVRLLDAGQRAQVQVEDNGPGIADDERERIFQPFYRALGTQVDGSGLGLAIVKEVVERHGGTVSVNVARPHEGAAGVGMALGAGALFTVLLPVGRGSG